MVVPATGTEVVLVPEGVNCLNPPGATGEEEGSFCQNKPGEIIGARGYRDAEAPNRHPLLLPRSSEHAPYV